MRPVLLVAVGCHLLSISSAAGLPDSARPVHRQQPQLFPWLTRLRDHAVQCIFGHRFAPATPGSAGKYERLIKNLAHYQKDVVLRFNVSTSDQEAALRRAADRMFIDVWDFNTNYADLRIEKADVDALLSLLPASLQTAYSTLIHDIPRAVVTTYPPKTFDNAQVDLNTWRTALDVDHDQKARQLADNLFFQDYQPLGVIVQWMRLIDSMFGPRGFVELVSIGKSAEGRDILGLRVGTKKMDSLGGRRKTILVTGGIHAREWISTSTTNYVAWSFITAYDKDPMITKIVERFDLVFVPVVNPDGYQYTWEVDRLWRKSRQRTNMQYCPGLDLDHAFGYRWDAAQHETDPCSESYGGEQPFQATEARELAQWATNETRSGFDFVGFVDLHSYSQQVLYPFAYSCAASPPNLENLQEVAMNMAKHLRLANGEAYTVASACEGAVAGSQPEQRVRLEASGGSAIDWFFHELHAHYSYQIKLRDTGSYGFLLPSEYIVPTGQEVFQAMKYFGDFLLGNNGKESIDAETAAAVVANVPSAGQDHEDDWTELRKRRR